MKKITVCFSVIFCLFLAGCGEKTYDVTITNNSTLSITYSYNGSESTLAPAGTYPYQVKAGTQAPTNISPPSRVKLSRDRDNFTFDDLPSIPLSVTNTAATNVTIKADAYIENGGSTEISLTASGTSGATTSPGIVIYTTNPSFIIVSPTPSNLYVQWSISGGTMTATIK